MVKLLRRLLIHIGRSLPFLLCFLVFISYTENLFALATNDFLYYDGYYIINTPISFAIGLKFEYDMLVIIISFLLSIAIETCRWNKYAIYYLSFNLFIKSYVADFELEKSTICFICVFNILVSLFLIFKGIKNYSKC